MSEECFCFAAPVDSCPTHGTREDETPTIPFIPPMEIVINEDGVMEFRAKEVEST